MGQSTTTYLYNNLSQLTKSTTNGVQTLYTYDANGNLTHKGSLNYSWNHENMLTGVSLDHWMENVHYTYDAMGKRIGRRYLDEAEYIFKDTRYFFEGINILLEKSCDDYGAYVEGNCSYVTNAVYTLAPGVIGHIISVNRNGIYYFYHYDPIGNVLFVTDASGNRNTSYVQEGFGNVVSQSGSADNKYHLTTKEIDSDTGLYYFYARWYDSGLGRFVSEDPIWHVNLYNYVDNNPITNIDPEGKVLIPWICFAACAACLADEGSWWLGCVWGCWSQKDKNFDCCVNECMDEKSGNVILDASCYGCALCALGGKGNLPKRPWISSMVR